jgi:phosphatidate cytidylyltransferase
MTAAPGKWNDLTTRVISAAVMVAVGAGEILLGGVWFQMLVVFVVAVIIWEVARMIRPQTEVSGMLLAALAASVLSGVLAQGIGWHLALMLLVPVAGALVYRDHALIFAGFALYVQIGGWALVQFREHQGLEFVLWLLGVVIATDILGYFAGRMLGGPKFWPRVSPKKTWSGAIAGWTGAALVGWAFMGTLGFGWVLVAVSVAVSLASQMGDIAESALKRYFAVKDSSSLIPGHGGVFDRFDALMGACVFLVLLSLAGWPG